MAAASRAEVVALELPELPPPLQRELALLFERYWPEGGPCDLDALTAAIVRWAFERELVWRPDSEQLRRQGCYFYPVTAAGDVRPIYLARRVDAPPATPRTARAPSLRDLGADAIERVQRA